VWGGQLEALRRTGSWGALRRSNQIQSIHPKSYFFCELKPHAKFKNTRKTPSWKKVTGLEEERRRGRHVVNSGHLVMCSKLKPLGPK
jgi:hypothetical protein